MKPNWITHEAITVKALYTLLKEFDTPRKRQTLVNDKDDPSFIRDRAIRITSDGKQLSAQCYRNEVKTEVMALSLELFDIVLDHWFIVSMIRVWQKTGIEEIAISQDASGALSTIAVAGYGGTSEYTLKPACSLEQWYEATFKHHWQQLKQELVAA